MSRRITIDIPDGVSTHDIHLAVQTVGEAVEKCIGHIAEAHVEDDFTATERSILARAVDLALMADETLPLIVGAAYNEMSGKQRGILTGLRARLPVGEEPTP